jgi:hypothetical protein
MPRRLFKSSSSRKVSSKVHGNDSYRPRMKSIDRLITNFYEIVGLDEFSREMSDRSTCIDKNDNLRDNTGTGIEASSGSNESPTCIKNLKYGAIDIDPIQEEDDRSIENEFFEGGRRKNSSIRHQHTNIH